MSLDLGDLADLATALGLLDGDGGLTADWFAKPGSYLTSVLRNPSQRDALLTVVGDLLGGGSSTTDAAGRRWLPIVRVPGGAFAGYATVTTGSTAVEIGAGIRVDVTSAGGVGCSAQVHVPLFAQPLAGGATTTLPGSAGAMVDLSVELTFPPGSATGGVGLGGAALTVAVPTHDGDRPLVTLALNGLQLPGAQAPADLVVSADTVADMDAALLQLVLGMVRAEAAALAADQRLRGLAAMLGLAANDVPDFPIDALLHTGPTALADWLARALGEAAARAAWLDGLATLVGGSVIGTGADAAVQVELNPGRLLFGLRVVPGAAGRPRVTPTLSFEVDGAAGITLALDVDPVTLDLGSGAAAALPLLRLSARLGGAGDQALLTPPIALPGGLAVGLDELDVGFAVDASRRPVLVLQAVQAKVGAATFPILDLTSPDALAAAAGAAVAAAAASLLTGLGDAGRAIGVLLGLADAPDGTVLPDVDAAHLLSDPLAALAEYWNHLLTGPPEQVQAVLGVLRDAIADSARHTVPVTGDGSREHPWRVPLAAGVVLTARYPDGVLVLGAELDIAVDDLAGSAVGAGLRAELILLELGLTGPHAGHGAFFPAASGALRFSATGGGPLALGTPPLQVRADAVGLGLSWSTGTDLSGSTAGTAGLRIQPVAEAARLAVGGTDLPLPVPGADGTLDLDADAWAAVESLAAAAAFAVGQATDSRWPAELVAALGWDVPDAPVIGPVAPSGPYLALADLVADPEQAVRGYLTEVLALADSTRPLAALLDLLGTLLGAPVRSIGAGRPDEPWRLPLLGSGADAVADLVPALISSLGPAGPASPPATLTGGVAGWQPGDPGLALPVLVNALTGEAAVDAGLRDLITGRGDLLTGLGDVLARLVGTDGLVTLPGSSGDGGLPAGITGHRQLDLAHSTPLDRIDLSGLDLFGGGPVPATVVHMAVIAPGLPTVVPDVSADHTLDLTGAGLPPESFTVHASADPAGAWVVKIGGRADCRLDQRRPRRRGRTGRAARSRAAWPDRCRGWTGPGAGARCGRPPRCAGLRGPGWRGGGGHHRHAVVGGGRRHPRPGARRGGAAAAGHAASGPRPGGLR